MTDGPDDSGPDREILEEFARWFKELPYAAASLSGEEPATEWDLHTVLAETAALRREVALQNREQSKSIRQFEKATEVYLKTFEEFRSRKTEVADLTRQVTSETEDRCLTRFLDVMDALERGQSAVRELRKRSWLFGRRNAPVEAIAEGYEMALRRMTRLLSDFEVRPVETNAVEFDPGCMNAIETRKAGNADAGTVAEVYQTGYRRRGKVLRYAEVAVYRKNHGE